MSGTISRRAFAAGGGLAIAGLAGCGTEAGHGRPQRRAASPPPFFEVSGTLHSRYTGMPMGWTIAMPGRERPRGIVYCLHAKGGNHRMAFDSIALPQVAVRLGWSMGGYGALLAAERAPARSFAAVSPASPALWLAPGDTAPGAFDSPADFYANDVFTGLSRLRPLTVAVCCGTADPFYPATRHLTGLMKYPHQQRFGPGGHDPAYWRGVAPWQLSAIGRALLRAH